MRRRIPALLVAMGFVVVLGGFSTADAAAQPAQADTAAIVRGGHFSPDTPAVDVYLTSFSGGTTTLFLSGVGYGAVSDYRRLPAGLYSVGMRPAGADPSTPVVLSWTLDAKAGDAFTACAVGKSKALRGVVLKDDLRPPTQGQGRVRVVQAASNAATVDVVTENGPVITRAAPFASSTNYTEVPAGTWPIAATSSVNPGVSARTSLSIAPGAVATIVVLDLPSGGITMHTVADAAGPAAMPIGSVSAGGGATARSSSHLGEWLALGLAATAAVGLALVIRRRH